MIYDIIICSRRKLLADAGKIAAVFMANFTAYSCSNLSEKKTDPATESTVSGGNCSANGTSAAISANHGHVLTVTSGEVNALAQITYDITGTSGHFHDVTITAAQFTTLQSNQGIQITSSFNGHVHIVTVNCL